MNEKERKREEKILILNDASIELFRKGVKHRNRPCDHGMGVKLIAKHRHTHYAGAWVPYTLIHLIDYLLVYLFDGTERKIGKNGEEEPLTRSRPRCATHRSPELVPVFLHGGDPQEAYTMPHDTPCGTNQRNRERRKKTKIRYIYFVVFEK